MKTIWHCGLGLLVMSIIVSVQGSERDATAETAEPAPVEAAEVSLQTFVSVHFQISSPPSPPLLDFSGIRQNLFYFVDILSLLVIVASRKRNRRSCIP